jgi:hypothetical protein
MTLLVITVYGEVRMGNCRFVFPAEVVSFIGLQIFQGKLKSFVAALSRNLEYSTKQKFT